MDNGYQVILCILLLLFSMSALSLGDSQGARTPISIVSGVYWKEIDTAELYEASVPLVYKTTWPGVDMAHLGRPAGEGFCNGTVNSPECVLYSWVAGVNKDIGARLSWLNQSLSETATNYESRTEIRGRRSLHFLGNFAHWCCGIVTGRQLRPLYANQQKMSLFERQISDELKEAYSEVDNLTLNMNAYSSEVERTFAQVIDVGVNITKIIDRFKSKVYVADQENHHRTYSLLQLSAIQEIRQLQTIQLITRLEILSQCREKKLPNSIISLTKLKNDLKAISESIKDDQYELVIPLDDVTKYLKLEIAECIISGTTIVVHVKIPIRKLGAQWKLYELIPVPFAWKGSTCSVQHKMTFLAVDGERLMTIAGVATHDCRPYDNPLCFVPRYAGDAVSGSLCPRAMFKGATIQELSSLCAFSCVPSQAPVVSKVDEDTYTLTHVSGVLEWQCRYGANQTVEIAGEDRPGALQVKVACDCRLVVNNQLLIFENYPCHKKMSVPEVVHIVPAAWSKLKPLKIPAGNVYFSSVFDTLDECLDVSWPTVVPHWNLTYSAWHRDIKPPVSRTSDDEPSVPLVFIIVHVVYLVVVTVIVVRNPHLLGLRILSTANAKPLDIYVTEETYSEFMYAFMITGISVICWALGKRLYRYWRNRQMRKVDETPLAVRHQTQSIGELPCGMPLAEVDGRELRVTLEWWDPNTDPSQKDLTLSRKSQMDI